MRASRRRTWLAACAALLTLPGGVFAQTTGKVPRIGILRGRTPANVRVWDGFFADLRQFGYVDGATVVVEIREFDNATTDPANRAAELVRLGVDVIVTGAPPAPEAARRATSTIPIVMTNHPDPVGSGLVSSLARPGGNVTGLSQLIKDLRGKQLELVKEVAPGVNRLAVLMNREVPVHLRELTEIQAAGQALNVRTLVVEARSVSDFEGAFASAARERAGAMIVLGGAVYFANRQALAQEAARHGLPTMYNAREYVEAGGLISYGPKLAENYRRAAWYVDRVLKGSPPQNLPVEQPSQFELVVNMNAAKALGLVMPPAILARAERI
ncbi:MAG: ABC transporter substrate-binding protein [Burkholderiales bacterium]|nr:ABC transporter substrate-binding protein [Burkholderiales bacterium]